MGSLTATPIRAWLCRHFFDGEPIPTRDRPAQRRRQWGVQRYAGGWRGVGRLFAMMREHLAQVAQSSGMPAPVIYDERLREAAQKVRERMRRDRRSIY